MIKYATAEDIAYLKDNDHHITTDLITKKVNNKEYLIAFSNKNAIGFLRFNYFWDNTPFINMLVVNEDNRKTGVGKNLMDFFEAKMKAKGFNMVMTSTLADETAQHFYRKLGYVDRGCLMLDNEALEILFVKKI